MWDLGHDYAAYGKLLLIKGKRTKADDYLRKAVSTFKSCGAEGWVTKKEKEYKAYC